MTADSRRNRCFVAGDAGDECRAGHGVGVQLGDPAIGQIFGGPRILPPEPVRYFGRPPGIRRARLPGGQQIEKPAREKMAMSVADTHGENAIIIGLVSDTHGLIRNSLFEALAGVSQILHAGDVGGRAVLDALSAIAPVLAVYGNVDPIDDALPEGVEIEEGGLSIHVSHGHELGSPAPARLLARYTADVIVFGHTHRPLVQRDGHRLVVNPGAAGPRRFDVEPSIAILRISGGKAEADIVALRS